MDLAQTTAAPAPTPAPTPAPAARPSASNRSPTAYDALFLLLLIGGASYALHRYGEFMDGYEQAILIGSVPSLAALGWFWKPLRGFMLVSAAAALAGIWLYQGELTRANEVFLLKYLLSSQTAIAWMSALVFLSTGAYWLGMLAPAPFAERCGSVLAWTGAGAGFTGMLLRWYESYLIGAEIGHIPISNLYEVFVLFVVLTTLMYLYYEGHYATRRLGAFSLTVIAAATGFLLWYSFSREAHEIQPLIPALQSYWMKIHVPANFVGYGAFALAAMIGSAWLLAAHGVLTKRLPRLEVLDDMMYRAIGVGFAFFTIATILGALWAAEAWGTYWQWDPKETWALIVWLNYAAWLHMRLTRSLRGAMLAWWALIGLLVTSFAFLGVNMFLSGLHSYGSL